jgi:hypothetical protein
VKLNANYALAMYVYCAVEYPVLNLIIINYFGEISDQNVMV